MSTLGSQRTRVTRLSIPAAGSWRADITLEAGTLPSGTQTLTMGSLVATGTVQRAAYDAPQLPHVVLVGGLGWDAQITAVQALALSMFADPGVRLSSVLTNLARLAGETIEQPTDRTVGLHWSAVSTRTGERVRFRDVLTGLVREGLLLTWWVGLDGVTRFTARSSGAVTGRATFLRGRGDVALRVYGTDDPAPFLPGRTVEAEAISRAVVVETPGSLTVECWGGGAPTIRDSAIRMVSNAFPSLVYGYPRTYLVESANADGTCDLLPPPASPYLRELESVPQWNTGGLVVTPVVGAAVAVSFLDASPLAPVILGWAPGVPLELVVDADDLLDLGPSADAIELAGGGPAVARVGDTCDVGTLTVQTTTPPLPAGVLFTYAPPGVGVPVAFIIGGAVVAISDPTVVPLVAEIDSGSAVVTCG